MKAPWNRKKKPDASITIDVEVKSLDKMKQLERSMKNLARDMEKTAVASERLADALERCGLKVTDDEEAT